MVKVVEMTTLRNRRGLPKERMERQDMEGMESMESKSLLQDVGNRREEMSLNIADGYILVPLRERHMFLRLDVWPFLFCYALLVILDFSNDALDGSFTLLYVLPQMFFPLVLLAHVALFLLCQWDIFWRASVGYQRLSMKSGKSSWTHCLVEAPHIDKHHAAHDAGIVQIRRQNNVVACRFQDVIFRCANQETDADITLWDVGRTDENSGHEGSTFHRLRYPAHLPLSFYHQWTGHRSLQNLVQAQQVYGNNVTSIRLPPFLEMLQEQLVAPFFLFQVLCVLLWCLDEYWYYAVFTFFALLMFESTVAYNRLKSLERLRSHTMHGHEKMIYTYRPAFPPGATGWVRIGTSEIVPGDIISCREATARRGRNMAHHQKQYLNRVPADILILSGDVVVDESLLTGESVPQLKTSLEETSTDRNLDLQEHKQSICFGGTNLLVTHEGGDTRFPAAPDGGVIGVVLRTGFETAQGGLLRTMAHTQKSVDGIHTRDTYIFILLLLLCAILSAHMVWEEGWADESRNRFRLILHVIMIITSVVPPELPMELSLAVTNSVTDLMKRCHVYCTEIFRIPIAGQVDVCCFDKTGTLTSDEMQLKGVRLVDNGSFQEVMKTNESLPVEPTFIMAACHTLALGGDESNNVIGDPLEKAIMSTTGYRLVKNNELQREAVSENRASMIQIVQRFNFTSRLKRMSVLARVDSGDTVWALTKGAPEVVKKLLKEGTCPDEYDKVSMYHMGRGQRVLAMAYRHVSLGQDVLTLKDLKRDDVECNLIFAGFLLLDCPIKGDSKSVIQELQSSGHNVKMITGDSLWTAAEVARQVGIVQKRNGSFPQFFQLERCHSNTSNASCKLALGNFRFVSMIPDSLCGTGDIGVSVVASDLDRLKEMVESGDASLCISGDALQDLMSGLVGGDKPNFVSSAVLRGEDKHALFDPAAQAVLKSLVPLVSVFARHAPRQKEAIVAAINLGGFKTLMCGDGTNDMASLRRAHVGISIISAPGVEAKQRSATTKISSARAKQNKERKKKNGTAKLKASNASLQDSLNQLREAQEELNSVELGDASIASPFTSRSVSIKCCKDVLQQGRCTLVTMLQIYKILGINCLVNAMVLSNLFLHGVKQGDRQLTVTGLAVAALFLFVTRGKPLDSISPIRPPASVLCRSALTSIAMQFGIHFWAIRLASQVSLSFVDPYDPSMIPDGPFNPNTLNTSTFLMNLLATVNTFAVNYRGEPFVEPLEKNKMLLRSLQTCYAVLLCCALELFPPLSDLLQLSEYPSVASDDAQEWQKDSRSTDLILSLANRIVSSFGFPAFMCGLMLVDTSSTFAVEKLILRLFEPSSPY